MKYFATAPSLFIDLPDKDAATRINMLIGLLGHQCADAEEAVEMYEEDRAVMLGQRHTDISTRYGRAEVINKYARRAHAHARTMVFAVDNFTKMIEALVKEPDADAAVLQSALDDFTKAVPGAKGLRDSLHHIEDRARKLDKRGKTITPTGMPTGTILAAGMTPDSVGLMFVGSNLMGGRIVTTAGDGTPVELEISDDVVRSMIDALQQVLNAFPWAPNLPGITGSRYPAS